MIQCYAVIFISIFFIKTVIIQLYFWTQCIVNIIFEYNVSFSFLSARCIRWPGLVPLRVSCRCDIDVLWLGLVCYTRLIRTLITVCSASFNPLTQVFDIPELRPQLIHWSFKNQGVERINLLPFTCRLWFEYGLTFPTLCLTPKRWIGSRVQFSAAQVLVGLRKQFINNFVFPLGPVLLLLIIIFFRGYVLIIFFCPFLSAVMQCGARLPIHNSNYWTVQSVLPGF